MRQKSKKPNKKMKAKKQPQTPDQPVLLESIMASKDFKSGLPAFLIPALLPSSKEKEMTPKKEIIPTKTEIAEHKLLVRMFNPSLKWEEIPEPTAAQVEQRRIMNREMLPELPPLTEEEMIQRLAQHKYIESQKKEFNKANIFQYFNEYLDSRTPTAKKSTAIARQRLIEFIRKEELSFKSINAKFLLRLCHWLRARKRLNYTTIKTYLGIYSAVVEYARYRFDLKTISLDQLYFLHVFIKDYPGEYY